MSKNHYSKIEYAQSGPVHVSVRDYPADSFRANVSANEVYHSVKCNAKRLRRAAQNTAILEARYTCLTCALRVRCPSFSAVRTAACSSKIMPLPPVTKAELDAKYVKRG